MAGRCAHGLATTGRGGVGLSLETITAAAPVHHALMKCGSHTYPKGLPTKELGVRWWGTPSPADASLPWGMGASGLGDLERARS